MKVFEGKIELRKQLRKHLSFINIFKTYIAQFSIKPSEIQKEEIEIFYFLT